jgi:hypothetical protein
VDDEYLFGPDLLVAPVLAGACTCRRALGYDDATPDPTAASTRYR